MDVTLLCIKSSYKNIIIYKIYDKCIICHYTPVSGTRLDKPWKILDSVARGRHLLLLWIRLTCDSSSHSLRRLPSSKASLLLIGMKLRNESTNHITTVMTSLIRQDIIMLFKQNPLYFHHKFNMTYIQGYTYTMMTPQYI